MTHIQLALFAKFSSCLPVTGGGGRTREYEAPEGATVADVVEQLGLTGEPRITFVNGRHAPDDHVLSEGDRLALFPPIAGG
jgi:sulfur carrier protein ThiS